MKNNITKTIDKLVKDYGVSESQINQLYENSERLWEYTQKSAKVKDVDKIALLILIHNMYLNHTYSTYQVNGRYKIYPLNQYELDAFYKGFIEPTKKKDSNNKK